METICDVLVGALWYIQTDAIINIRFVDADADTYNQEPMYKLLSCYEKQKKDNSGKHSYEKRKNFSPFFLSADGMLVKDALVILSNLSQLMSEKLEEPISHVRGWVN